ncbi:MAG: hypothetical protein CVU41_18345 [Chloroflexi bacterium HGW-Chloroflexi-3]|nr:MAG: hypothetical protein CVU41_18345 [Chloroflexi bacterium HGW-Chloroflexi-3]
MIKKILSSNAFLFLSVSLTTGLFYLFTVSQRLTWANFGNDGGDFISAILTGGIPHPTGYPTYTFLGTLFQKIPVGDPYFRAAMLSWLPAAIGAGLLARLIKQVLNDKSTAISTSTALLFGWVWGWMPFLWSQAVIIEVHGLQSLFLVLALWWIWILLNAKQRNDKLYQFILLSFCYGLAIGNHITILLFLPAIFFALLIAYKNGLQIRIVLGQILAIGIGTLIYLYLPLRSAQYPPINWGNPQTWQGFWWVISGNPYQNLIAATSISHIFTRISALAGLLIQQFGYLGVILGVIGAVQYKHQSKNLPFILVYIFFAFSFFAILYGTDDSITYLLAPFLVFAIWIGLGIATIIPFAWKKWPVGYVLLAVYSIMVIAAIPGTVQTINPRLQTQPADYAEYLMEHLPENTILLTSEDRDSFPLWYYHFGLKQRSDLVVIVLPLSQFRWYQETLTHTYPEINFPDLISQTSNKSGAWGESVPDLNPKLPVCRSTIQKTTGNSIYVLCSTGQNYNFVIFE